MYDSVASDEDDQDSGIASECKFRVEDRFRSYLENLRCSRDNCLLDVGSCETRKTQYKDCARYNNGNGFGCHAVQSINNNDGNQEQRYNQACSSKTCKKPDHCGRQYVNIGVSRLIAITELYECKVIRQRQQQLRQRLTKCRRGRILTTASSISSWKGVKALSSALMGLIKSFPVVKNSVSSRAQHPVYSNQLHRLVTSRVLAALRLKMRSSLSKYLSLRTLSVPLISINSNATISRGCLTIILQSFVYVG